MTFDNAMVMLMLLKDDFTLGYVLRVVIFL